MEFNAENIERVVYQFYFVPNEQVHAHEWLNLAQSSVYAWKFCWDLIQPEKSKEVQFFGANTLCIKVSRFWSELKEDEYEQLKNKILEAVIRYTPEVPNIVLTRLCIALSCFMIRTISSHWNTAIVDLINVFRSENDYLGIVPEKRVTVLLQLLQVLPEEFQTMTLAYSFRAQVRHQLTSNSEQIISCVRQVLATSTSLDLNLTALTCLRSWIIFGIDFLECLKLVETILNFVSVKELTEISTDVLISIVNHHDGHKYSTSILVLLDSILKLENLLLRALQEGDVDTCCCLYNLYVSFGENYSRLMLTELLKDENAKANFLKLVNIILSCTATNGQYPIDEKFSSLSFNFWYNLQDDIISNDNENCQILINLFEPVFKSLVDVLLRKVMSPKIKSPPYWTSDDVELFRCYHQDVGDTLTYCYNILRHRMLEQLINHLVNFISKARENNDVGQALQACLYAFESVADSVEAEEKHYIPKFMELVINIPFNNDGDTIAAALSAIGAYGDWMSNYPQILDRVIPLILNGLYHKDAASSATMALKEISRESQPNMTFLAKQILISCSEVFVKGLLKPQDEIRLMCVVGYMTSLLPYDEAMSYCQGLLAPFFKEFEQTANDASLVMTPTMQDRLKMKMSILTALFSTLNTKEIQQLEKCDQPGLLIYQQLLPILHKVVARFPSASVVTNAICELVKRAIGNLLDDLIPVVEETLELLKLLYCNSNCIFALEVFKLVALMFADNSDCRVLIQNTFVVVVNVTLLKCGSGLSENCDVAETFCQVLAQLIRKQHLYIFHSEINLLALFHFGVAVLSIPEASTVKAASTFMTSFINKSQDHLALSEIINNHGVIVINQILMCIGSVTSPRGVMDYLTDVLLAMIKKYFENTSRWLQEILKQDNFPSPHVTSEDKQLFIKRVIKEHSNRRKLQEVIKYFTLSCRGILGTEYAAQVVPNL